MTRRLIVIALAALLEPLFVGEANAAQPGAPTIVETIPATPNLRVVYQGTTYRTDSHGVALLPPRLISRPRVLPTAVSANQRAVFQRWYGRSVRLRAALDVYYRVRLRYVDLQGRPIDPNTVSSIQIRSSIGERFHPTTRILWLRGTRVVPLNGGLESKPIYYTIERVVVGGSNVVNESQQKFFPARERGVTVQLLFYRARFRSRDAFFGFAVGDRIRLTFPQGTTRRYRLGADGTVVLPSLPRGNYHVEVEGGGLSLGGPVALSRDQDVKVGVVSYLDLAVVAAALALFAIGLPLVRRPHRLRQLRGRIGGLDSALPGRAVAAAPLAAFARLPAAAADIVAALRRVELDRLRGAKMGDAAASADGATGRVERKALTPAPLRDGNQLVAPAQQRGASGATVGLAAANGLVNLNTATVAQLDALPGIGPATAHDILAYRQAHGAFRSIDELAAIRGIGPARLDRLRRLVAP